MNEGHEIAEGADLQSIRQRLDGQARCNLAADVTTHPIGHREHRAVTEVAVLVDLAGIADIGGLPVAELGHRSSSTVSPT